MELLSLETSKEKKCIVDGLNDKAITLNTRLKPGEKDAMG
jgi:hypothetical protein